MASRAAVLIDLSVADATPALRTVAAAADDAADAVDRVELSAKDATAAIRDHAKEAARVGRAIRDFRVVEAASGAEHAAALIRSAHGAEIAALAELKLGEQTEKAAAKARQATAAHDAQTRAVRALDRAVDGLGKRTGELGGDLARFGGQMDVLGDAGRPITLLGDAIELMSSPLGAAVGLSAAWGASLVGAVAGSVALVAASDDLIARLEIIGAAAVITPTQTEQLRIARASITAIGDAWAMIATTLAANVGPQIESAAALIVGASIAASKAFTAVSGSVDLLSAAVNMLTGGLLTQIDLVSSALDAVQEAMAGLSPAAKIALNVATGGMSGLVEAAAGAADTLGDVIDRVREQGRQWITTTDAARTASEAIGVGMRAASGSTRAASRAAEQYASALARAAGNLQGIIDAATADTLDPATRAIRDFGRSLERIGDQDIGAELSGLVDAAQSAVEDRLHRVLEEIAAQQQAAIDAFAALPAASAVALEAIAAARRATLQSVAGGVAGVAGVVQGNIGGALAAAGPAGMIAATLIELGPDTAEMLDERLSEIGEAIVRLPETLAKVLATLIGFGADNTGEGIGRAIGLAVGIGLAVAIPGLGLAAGAAVAAAGSAAGGALGNAAASRESNSRRRPRPHQPVMIVNGIITANAVRTLDREAKTQGGSRGLRTSLARGGA